MSICKSYLLSFGSKSFLGLVLVLTQLCSSSSDDWWSTLVALWHSWDLSYCAVLISVFVDRCGRWAASGSEILPRTGASLKLQLRDLDKSEVWNHSSMMASSSIFVLINCYTFYWKNVVFVNCFWIRSNRSSEHRIQLIPLRQLHIPWKTSH